MAEHVKIMMSQHVGVSATPLVTLGERVKKGQLIAACNGLGANIHSSVYGEIIHIDPTFVEISADLIQPDEYVKIKHTATNLEAIKEAGIVGAGGAGFPAHIKYDVDLQGGFVILNAAECEPGLLHNKQVLIDNAQSVVRGVKYIMEITNASRSYIALKRNTDENSSDFDALKNICKAEEHIEVKYVSANYPAGDERVIIRELLGVELQPGQLPMSVGAIVSNVETAKRVTEAIELRKPMITKDFSVGGRLRDTFGGSSIAYLDQPIGVSVGKYIGECGGYIEPHGEIVLGGPFMGKSGEESSVITKVLGGILVAMPFPADTGKFGILSCECGAQETRLRDIVHSMGGTVACELKCKRMIEVQGRHRCEKPGACPGQAESALWFKTNGAEAILAGACED